MRGSYQHPVNRVPHRACMTDTQHTDTPDNEQQQSLSLVWSTTTTGPARQIISEWERLTHRPAVLRRANEWEFLPRPVNALDEILTMCGFGMAIDDPEGDEMLWHLVCRAEHDDLAARVVLHRIMPALMGIAHRRGRITKGGAHNAMAELLSTAWIVIRQFPHDRRRHKIAANLVLDVEYFAFVRARRLKRVPEAQVGDDMLSQLIESPRPLSSEVELEDVLSRAIELGVSARHIEILQRLGAGTHGTALAEETGVSPRTIRNHRRIAVEAVREAFENIDA